MAHTLVYFALGGGCFRGRMTPFWECDHDRETAKTCERAMYSYYACISVYVAQHLNIILCDCF